MKSQMDVKATLALGIVIFLLLLALGQFLTAPDLSALIAKAISITAGLRYVFVKWIWKWPWLRFLESLHGVPYIEGNWDGTIESTGNDKTPESRRNIPVQVRVSQPDIFTTKVVRTSDESSSSSFGETIQVGEDGRTILVYSYQSEPKATVMPRSAMSYGSARLVLSREKPWMLVGNYWTDQKTTGVLSISRRDVDSANTK